MNRTYWKFVALYTAHMFAVQLVLPVLAPYFSSLGYSDTWISFVFGMFPFVMIFATLLVGELSEQIGRTWTVRIAFGLTSVAYVLYFLGWEWGILLARIIDALAFSALAVLLLSKIQDQVSDGRRGRFTGILLTIQTAVQMFAPVLGGYLADRYLGAPFLLSIGLNVALMLSLRRATLHQKAPVSMHPLRNLRWFFTSKELRPMALLGPCMHFLQPAIIVFVPLVIVKQLGGSYSDAGLAMMLFTAGHLLQFLTGDLADTFGRRKFIVLGAAIMSCTVLALAYLPLSIMSVILLMGVYGVGGAFWNTAAIAYMSDVAERENKEGVMVGTYLSIAKVGQVISFAVAGGIVAVYGYAGVFFLLGGMGLLGCVAASALFWVSHRVNPTKRLSVTAPRVTPLTR